MFEDDAMSSLVQIIKYQVQSGRFRGTELGRLPSYYEEKLVLTKLLESVTIPVKESAEKSAAKINVLRISRSSSSMVRPSS
jgi:hypothetical protein